MNNEWLSCIWQHFNILAAMLALAAIAGITIIGKRVLFAVPVLGEMRAQNKEKDKPKWKMEKYPPVVRATQRVGMYCNLTFFFVLLPFCITLQAQPAWKVLLDIVVILMFYDFFYYLTHRFLFHKEGFLGGPLMSVHAIHHRQHNPCRFDSGYLHPVETAIGMGLYAVSIFVLSRFLGGFHVVTIVLTWIAFTQINLHNHDLWEEDRFPFRYLAYASKMHHNHHTRFTGGNFATITVLYDWMFGTLDNGKGRKG